MGAFAGILSAMSGLAANTRDQGQRQAQRDMIEQLRAQGLLEENAGKAFDLQDAIEQRTAKQKILADPSTPPEVKQRLALGMSPADALKMQSQSAAVALYPKMLTAKPETRAQMLADALTANPSLADSPLFPDLKKLAGISEKPAKESDFEQWYKTLPPGTPMIQARAQWMAAGRAPKDESAGGAETPIPLSDITTVGGKTGYWAKSKTGAPKFVEMPGATMKPTKPAKGAERKQLSPAAMNQVTKQIDNEWAMQPNELDLNPMNLIGTSDRKREFYATRKKVILYGMGYDESGRPFKNGQQIKDPQTGKMLTWKDS